MSNAESGFDAKSFLKKLTSRPGVYRMLDSCDKVIYIGKAKNLKKRVASYFTKSASSSKTQAMVSQVCNIEVTVTHTENEALILENNLIKEFKPRYNILLRDDKSYPYIFLSSNQVYPRLTLHRGKKEKKGKYFGPYPSSGAVRETLNLLQKLFKIRQCEDNFFRNRSRPCLQYQIKRCTAPCVGIIDEASYQLDVRHAVMFIQGRNQAVIEELVKKMEQASDQLQFEKAAVFRDQVASIRKVLEKQTINKSEGELDVIASVVKNGIACVNVFFIRGGQLLGDKAFFPRHPQGSASEEILDAFISQYYLQGRMIPGEILLSESLKDTRVIEETLGSLAGHQVSFQANLRGDRARLVKMAVTNAKHSLEHHLSSKANLSQRYHALQDALNLDSLPARLECFDISHTSGQSTVASCVVFDHDGPLKSDYRRFNIDGIQPGDDYAALYQALSRRYTRLKKGDGKIPDILFIDGGKGQLRQAAEVLEELQVDNVVIVGIAKGRERKPGKEKLFIHGQKSLLQLPESSPALHLIQHIRDEAHRFAITGHRNRRNKAQHTSVLDGIEGVGVKRRRNLIKQFGGIQGVARAGVEDLTNVRGISRQLAQKIYDSLHIEEQ
ncbi:MAG: excinuclease ABC subunit UvrC [Gammaproteobacteria bacterium]